MIVGLSSAALDAICQSVASATGARIRVTGVTALSGGCINQAFKLESNGNAFFVKTNSRSMLAMFEAELAGLRDIQQSKTIRVPAPICSGMVEDVAYLVLEFIDMSPCGGVCAERLGRELAAMHRTTQASFGWRRDNTIGSTPQHNSERSDWIEFWRDLRLGHQLELAAGNGYRGALQSKGERLLERYPLLFADYSPQPSLLHGDLWSGNHCGTPNGEPVIFDPAVYYGDRECDIAMTELFGGFPQQFYASYRETWSLDSGYPVRKTLYNLYHILNHLNLFGGGYASQAERMIDTLLAELS